MENLSNLGGSWLKFEVDLPNLDDGNYKLKWRGFDLKNNLSQTKAYSMVIDRLPPRVGLGLFALGSQLLNPREDGSILSSVGVPFKIFLSAVGGPTQIDLESANQSLPMSKNSETNLWSTEINLEKPGSYRLTTNSVDGADNKETRLLNKIIVLENGRVTDGQRPIKDAKLSVYYFEKTLKQFVLWDGLPYGQTNPQLTAADGSYRLYLPAGSYYLYVNHPGYKSLKTDIFYLDGNFPISQSFQLEKSQWFDFGQKEVSFNLGIPVGSDSSWQKLINQELPNFNLENDQGKLTNFSLRGKLTVLSFLSTFDPTTSQQIGYLEELKNNPNLNVVAVFPEQSISTINIFQKRGAYSLPMFADPDGNLIEDFSVFSVPTHFIIDRKGIVKTVRVGVMDKQILTNELIK